MNNKVLVEVRVPAADSKFDAFLPLNCKGEDAVKIISTLFSQMFEGKFKKLEDSLLCIYDTEKVLDINKKIYEQDITNGTVLILI